MSIKKEIRARIPFYIPISVSKGIVNADADVIGRDIDDYETDNQEMLIDGIACTEDIDLDEQRMKPEGFDLSYFLKSGFINWNHQVSISPDTLIGEPIEAKVNKDKFYIKARLYNWSNLAKSVYLMAKNLEEDPLSDRVLGFSVEGVATEIKDSFVNKVLITSCAIAPIPKNNKTYLNICKGITQEEIKDINKSMFLQPIYSEINKGITREFVINLDIQGKKILVDKDFNFEIRDNNYSFKNLEELQKAIILFAKAKNEGIISQSKVEELQRILKRQRLNFNN